MFSDICRLGDLIFGKVHPPIPYTEIAETLGTIQTLGEIAQGKKKRKLDLSTLGYIELPPFDDLSDHFTSLTRKSLHIIVELPPARETNDNKGFPSEFVDFHRQCWGQPLDHGLTTLPTNDSDLESGEEVEDYERKEGDILPGDPFLHILGTHFLVRAEYIRALHAVKTIFEKSGQDHLAVVTGQPGIGATTSIVSSSD